MERGPGRVALGRKTAVFRLKEKKLLLSPNRTSAGLTLNGEAAQTRFQPWFVAPGWVYSWQGCRWFDWTVGAFLRPSYSRSRCYRAARWRNLHQQAGQLSRI